MLTILCIIFPVSYKRWLSSKMFLMSAKQIRDNTSFILSSLVILHQISRDFMWWCMPWFKDIIFFNGHQPCFNIEYGPNYLIWHLLKSSYSTCFPKGLLCNTPSKNFIILRDLTQRQFNVLPPSKYDLQHGPFLRDLQLEVYKEMKNLKFFSHDIIDLFMLKPLDPNPFSHNETHLLVIIIIL